MPPSSSKRRSSNQTSTRAEAIKAACKRADEQLQETPPPEPSTRDREKEKDNKKSCSSIRRLSAAISDTDETDPNHHHHHHTHSLNHNLRLAQAHAHAHAHAHAQVNETILLPSSENAEDGCLHCHKVSTDIQVRCDECQAYICPGCHWCHEYQANHEIRVCDRCDAFYCRNCDEMDQCDDCGEVVCASCSTLLSCKFCGGGLCEECATACGRCGIVLCSRDAKFAVECDTCRLSYCLVCLASGSKDPCVRCGHRPSKRMEQLVHLRLKSIYKAFKQSSKSPKEQFEQFHNHDHALEHGPNTFDEFTLSDGMQDMPPMRHPKEDLVLPTTTSTTQPDEMPEHVLEEKQKEADAAAEALLAELEEEEEAAKTKKSKKKKKKERLQQKTKQKDDEPSESVPALDQSHSPSNPKAIPTNTDYQTAITTSRKATPLHNDETSSQYIPISNSNNDKFAVPEENVTLAVRCMADPIPSTDQQPDPFEKRLCECVEESDIDGIEEILFELKGVPGRAALRKNAKKALKRLRAPASALTEDHELECKEEPTSQSTLTKGPVDLLKLVSDNNIPGKQPNRAECVMQMSPQVVGWVIGKGGQRIRDLMEESGAKVWIDQEKAKPDEARNVYISGDRNAVDLAVHMVRDIVSKAPIEGAAKYAPYVEDGPNKSLTISPVQNPQEAGNRRTFISNVNATVPVPIPNIMSGTESRLPPAAPLKPRTVAPTIGLAPPVSAQTLTVPLRTGFQDDDQCEHMMTCEARFVPLLIGKRGWAVKDIQDKSGARVDIDQTVTPRQIRISGSRASVDKAIPMVRDVLNYPHAQPQQGFDLSHGVDQSLEITDHHLPSQEPTLIAHTPEDRQDTPPPYSFITTGDARSAISASSSLSSTPEPFLATTSVKTIPAQMPTNTLLSPPDYRMPTISQMHSPSPLTSQYVQQDFPMGMNRVGDHGAFGPRQALPPTMYNGNGLVGMQHMQGMSLPIPQQSHDPLNSHAAKPSPLPYGPTTGMHGQPPLMTYHGNNEMVSPTHAKSIHDIHGGHAFAMNVPPPDHRNRGMGSMENTQQLQNSTYGPIPSGPPVGGVMAMQAGTSFDGRGENPFGSWDSGQMDRNYAFPTGMAPGNLPPLLPGSLGLGPPPISVFTNSFHLSAQPPHGGPAVSGTTSSAPLGQGYDMGSAMRGRVPGMTPFNAPMATPNPSAPGNNTLRDDSRIIDSLFGPSSSSVEGQIPSASDPAQHLITGLNTLHLGSSVPSSGVPGGGTGFWGSSLTDWNTATVTQSKDLESLTNEAVLESSILAGLPPFPLIDDSHQHPPQSRFHWGSTNA